MIAIKIDVTKIEKERLFQGKNGAQYLDCVLIDTPNDKWGNSHMVVQSVSKEEREAGKKGPILGNAKTVGGGGGAQRAFAPRRSRPTDEQLANRTNNRDDSSVPF